VLNYEGGWIKLFIYTAVVLLCSHWFDLYDTARLNTKGELYFRLLMVLGLLAFVTAFISYIRPDFLMSGNSTVLGLLILTIALVGWRLGFGWLVQLPMLVERVYVLGTGERAQRLVQGLRQNPEIGVEIASWTGKLEGAVTRESVAEHLMEVVKKQKVHRVIVAMPDRRGTIPCRNCSTAHAGRQNRGSDLVAGKDLGQNRGRESQSQLAGVWRWLPPQPDLLFASPLFLDFHFAGWADPYVALDPADHAGHSSRFRGAGFLYADAHGQGGKLFKVVKFRTMRQDAEAANGPQWAGDNDPRVTRVGRFLRTSRLDEIPQLWCVLKGDMAFVGPRPERPEFIELLSKEIPFYGVRHMVRPGVTGWAQIKYKYGSTIEDARKNCSTTCSTSRTLRSASIC
jgi:hypothetical protein